jgi:hypothetical protein
MKKKEKHVVEKRMGEARVSTHKHQMPSSIMFLSIYRTG